MHTKLRRRAFRAFRLVWPAALTVVAALAMIAPSLTPLIGDDLAAYRPDHGHLVASSVVPPHDHPYDDHDGSHRRAESDVTRTQFAALPLAAAGRLRGSEPSRDVVPSPETGEGEEIVFTHGGDGSPGSTSAPALPAGAAVAAAASGWSLQASAAERRLPSSLALLVPAPPPRA